VTGNAIINSKGQGNNPVCSTRDEISQPSRPFSPRAATCHQCGAELKSWSTTSVGQNFKTASAPAVRDAVAD